MKSLHRMTASVRTLLALLFLAWAALPASAQIKKGDSILSLGLGLGLPVSDLDLSNIGAGNQKPGEPGLAMDGRYLYQVNGHIGLGGQIGHRNFGDKDFVVPRLAGTIGSSLLTFQGVARYLFTPEKVVSPYIIGGLGMNQFSSRVRETFDPRDVLLDTDSTGLAVSAGAGVEGSLAKSVVAGAEISWLFSTIDSGKFGVSTLNTLDFMLRLGYKF